jgi:hypothetical protein
MFGVDVEKRARLGTISRKRLDPADRIGRIRDIHIYAKDFVFYDDSSEYAGKQVEVFLFDESYTRRIMTMQLKRQVGDTYSVEMVNVDSKYQGFKLAPKIYKKLVQRGITLVTGGLQSRGGQYIWSQLVGTKGIQMSAFKLWTREVSPRPPRCLSKRAREQGRGRGTRRMESVGL